MEPDTPSQSSIDRFYKRIRNNPIVASLILVSTIVIAIASFTDAASKLLAPFKRQSPAAARTQLAQLNMRYDAEAFIASAAAGDATAVKLFLAAGMDPNTRTDREGSALGNAAFAGRAEVVSLLLAAGARIVGDGEHPSPLGSAATGGHTDLVRTMLDHKPAPDADAIDEAFVMAARRGAFWQERNYAALTLLAERGARVRKVAPAILEEVFQRGLGDVDARMITQTLLDLGADVDGNAGNDRKMMTPLMAAASDGYRSTADLLLARGARIDAHYDRPEAYDRGWTALMLATRQRNAEVVEDLLARGADVEETNSNGDNALLLAARHGDAPTMQAVLAKATRLDARDRDGRTALMLLVEGVRWPGEAAVVPFDAVKVLLDRGARVDLKDKVGTTALMICAESGSPPTLRLLLDHGARTSDRDAKGRRAIDYARNIEDPARMAEIVRLLQKAG
jgi:ankyrin repeat protein